MDSAKDGDDFLLGGQRDGAGNSSAVALSGLHDLSSTGVDQLVIVSLQSDADHFLVCHGLFSSLNFVLSLRRCLGTVRTVCSRLRAYHSRPRKMADARPTFPLPQRYTQRKTEAVQPPDDRTYSAEVTSFPSNLLHHRSARSEKFANFPYTRPIMISPFRLFVKHIF